MKLKFKLLKYNNYYRTVLDNKIYKVLSDENLSNYIEAKYKILEENEILLFDVVKVEKFDSNFNQNAGKPQYFGAHIDFYLENKESGNKLMSFEGISEEDAENYITKPLVAHFVNNENTEYFNFLEENTKEEFEEFIKRDENRVFRFYNLGEQGSFLIYFLESIGYRQPHERAKKSKKKGLLKGEYTAIQNPKGKIYSIKWKNGNYETTVFDTLNVVENKDIGEVVGDFGVEDFDGSTLVFENITFKKDDWFDENGLVKDSKIWYNMNRAVSSLQIYNAFIEDDLLKKHFKNRQRFLTVGSVGWSLFLKETFGEISDLQAAEMAGKMPNYIGGKFHNKHLLAFKNYVGDWSHQQDAYFRKYLYRGGYNFVNKRYYNQELEGDFIFSDINSAYPYMLTSDRLCGKLLEEGAPGSFEIDEDNYVYIYDITFHELLLKDGYFPYVQNPNATVLSEDSLVIGETRDMNISVFDFELKTILEVYEASYTVHKIYKCEKIDGKIFKSYVEHFFNKKENPKNPTEKKFSKLMLNAITGKIGEEPIKSKVVFKNENGKILKLETDELVIGETRSVPLISNITALLREYIYRSAQRIGFKDVLMIGTDGITYVDNGFNFNGFEEEKQLGKFSSEKYKRIKILGPKMYQVVTDKGELKNAISGLNSRTQAGLKFGDLKIGIEYNAIQRKQVEGGIIYINVNKKIIENTGGVKV